MNILYLGLSNQIFGLAEGLHSTGNNVHFVRPGDLTSRIAIAKSVLISNPIDAVVLAEVATLQARRMHAENRRTSRVAFCHSSVQCGPETDACHGPHFRAAARECCWGTVQAGHG